MSEPDDLSELPTGRMRQFATGQPLWDDETMPTLGGSVLRYVEMRRQAGEFAPTTAKGVRWILWRFGEIAGLERSPRTLTRRQVEKWIGSRSSVAPATLRLELSVVRTYCQWLVDRGDLRRDPTMRIKGPPKPRDVPRALAGGDVARLLAKCPDMRARLIVSLMVQEGLRCMEVSALQVSDVDLVDDTLLVVGKGGHERLLPLSTETHIHLSRYLHELPATAGALIRSYQYQQRGISPNHISVLVTRWMGDAHIKASAHALRHTMASDMLERCGNVRDVQMALGHVSLGTTQRYLRRSEGKRLREAMGGRRYAEAAEVAPPHRLGLQITDPARVAFHHRCSEPAVPTVPPC